MNNEGTQTHHTAERAATNPSTEKLNWHNILKLKAKSELMKVSWKSKEVTI